jgi:hypothetical protein
MDDMVILGFRFISINNGQYKRTSIPDEDQVPHEIKMTATNIPKWLA